MWSLWWTDMREHIHWVHFRSLVSSVWWCLFDICLHHCMHLSIKNDRCEACGDQTWGSTHIGCILEVKCHQCGNTYLTFAYIIACIKKNWCEAWGELIWGSSYMGCILEVICHQCGNAYLTFAYITACIFKALRIIDVNPMVNWPEGARTLDAF